MLMLRNILRQLRFGIALTVLIVAGTALYVEVYGPLYGVWGWPELVLGGLIVMASLMVGLEATLRQPNPYTRTNPLYGLLDVSPNRDLDPGDAGWLMQSLPLFATAIALAGFFLLT